MKNVKYYSDIKFKSPAMIACWSGMGNVGLGAADYIKTRLNASLLAEVELKDLVPPEAINVRRGLSSVRKAPGLLVYYTRKPDLIIAIGKEQHYGYAAAAVMDRLLDVAEKFKVKRIYTCAAFPTYMSYKSAPTIFSVANNPSLLKFLREKHHLAPMDNGQISGLNGLLLEASRARKIGASCLLATLPIYGISLPNPRASRGLIDTLARIVGFRIDTQDLNASIREIDATLHNIEEQLRGLGVEDRKNEPAPPPPGGELPKGILDKIEGLFEQAGKDKKIAHKLKQELDRWDLFKVYEDRFLDLFRENQ
jgi:predicted ATP-grasp superfamily ATP-dependent carboligase